MKSSEQWVDHFKANLAIKRIDWNQPVSITQEELKTVLKSLQAWQLGETSDGKNLLRASSLYAAKTGDPFYIKAVQLFIKEEQKHGNNLGRYLDLVGKPRIRKDWGDTLFRKVRYFNTSMELWTLAVITVESCAQLFYQSLKDATGCGLLKQVCTDILIDEASHIHFQMERLAMIYESKTRAQKILAFHCYKYFFFCTSFLVWAAHRKVFRAGGNGLMKFYKRMNRKFRKTLGKLTPGAGDNQLPLAV